MGPLMAGWLPVTVARRARRPDADGALLEQADTESLELLVNEAVRLTAELE